MHYGPAVERSGDRFGATVDLAARLAGLASGGEVLLTATVRDAAGELDGISFERRGEQSLRNVAAPVVVLAARSSGTSREPAELDPVCRMAVSPGREAGTLTHAGRRYVFSSLECASRFAADPGAYVDG